MAGEFTGKTVLIACKMLQHEINKALEEVGFNDPIVWVDSEYHNEPDALRDKLQQEIDKQKGASRILLAYGCCGNGTLGLRATTGELVIPKTEDCISMLMTQTKQKYLRPKATYFITKGWLEGTRSIAKEIEHTVKRYGKERAQRILAMMFKHYKYLMLIDTRSYDVEECLPEARQLAQSLNLELTISKGDICFLRDMLARNFGNNFIIIPKGEVVKGQDFACCSQDYPRQTF